MRKKQGQNTRCSLNPGNPESFSAPSSALAKTKSSEKVKKEGEWENEEEAGLPPTAVKYQMTREGILDFFFFP